MDLSRAVESLERGLRDDLRKHSWAARIVFLRFAEGLVRLSDPHVAADRYNRFRRDADPVYGAVLAGLNDEALAATFVSYWKIAHTMATQSRFWLEDAIAEIVLQDPSWEGKSRRVYTGQMLAAGMYGRGRGLAELGEDEREELLTLRRPWEVMVQRSALEAIDQLVGTQERTGARGSLEGWDHPDVIERDRAQLRQVERSLVGPPPEPVLVHCNLLIVEPPRADGSPHMWAFRFVNPRTMGSHAERKQERVNLLRVFAFLAQEKILRDPRYLQVAAAEIVPRDQQISGATYFSSKTYWAAAEFWKFLGVPFEVVESGIKAAGLLLGEQLRNALARLLPRGPSSPS